MVDWLMRFDQWAVLDTMLLAFAKQADKYDVNLLGGFLTASFPGRSKLTFREKLFGETERVAKERGEWEPGLLKGLENE